MSPGHRGDAAPARFRAGAAGSTARAGDSTFESDRYWYGDGQMPGDYRQKGRPTNGAAGETRGNADGGGSMTGTIRDAAGAVGQAVSDAADGVGDAASDLMGRLSHGLDDLTEEARSRILSARRAAHDARQSSAAVMARGSRAATGLFEAQPLVLGALAMAVGAAIGGVLPHSKLEDDTMGDSSDRLFADAQALYHAERDKAVATLRMAATDAKGEVREMGADLADLLPDGKSVGEVIVDRVAEASTRVFQRATGDDVHPEEDRLPT
jgi:hypothetical protein